MIRPAPLVADLHVHSRHSRATSPRMRLGSMHDGARLKGIDLLGTGDLTHPAWFAELRRRLEPAEPGLYRLRPGGDDDEPRADVPSSCRRDVRFLLSGEVATVYRAGGRTRKVHHLVLMPSLDDAGRFAALLGRLGNLASDGRPILGLDSERLLALVLEASPRALLIPAHVWTPHFSVLGAASAFGSLEECYGALAPHVTAVETGLSSDPAMNRRLSSLDSRQMVSFSDAHSPGTLGREATLLAVEPSFEAVREAFVSGRGLAGTLEFFPEEGKYHLDGHRPCGQRLTPAETRASGGRCPACGGRVTVGVLHRVEELADRPSPAVPPRAPTVEHLVPLRELLAELHGVGPLTRTVDRAWGALVGGAGGELPLLRTLPLADVEALGGAALARGLRRLRRGDVRLEGGYDGVYGRVRCLDDGTDDL